MILLDPIISSYKKVLKNNNIEIAGIEFLIDENERLLLMISIQIPITSIARVCIPKKEWKKLLLKKRIRFVVKKMNKNFLLTATMFLFLDNSLI